MTMPRSAIPAKAGTRVRSLSALRDSRVPRIWIPVFAGMTVLLASLALAQSPQATSVEPRAPGDTLRDAGGGFELELTLESTAGETLQAGELQIEFLGTFPAGAPLEEAIFSDGFEPATGVTP